MKLVFTDEALRDLENILMYVSQHYHPVVLPALQSRLRNVLARITLHPESARQVEGRSGVRVAAVVRYPYKIFYRVSGGKVEVLHIHHSARGE